MEKGQTIRELRCRELSIPFTETFRHASAERARTSSVWVEAVAEQGVTGYGESCPRPYVTGETVESAQAFISRHQASICREITDRDSAIAWMTAHGDDVDREPAAWCALEIAVLDLFAKIRGETIEGLLSVPPLTGSFQYSAVVGDAEPVVFAKSVARYRGQGFSDFKVKLSGNIDRDRAKLGALIGESGIRIRLDANNLWGDADAAIEFLRGLECPFFAIEEPLRPNQYRDLGRMADALGCQIVLDESLVRPDQIVELGAPLTRWLINLRVSKMGGLLRSLRLVEAARRAGIGIIVGAQVGETSVLTRAALTVAQAARDRLIAQEGAFGTFLLTADVCEPSLVFGAGGVLDVSRYPALGRPGLGIM